MLNNSYLFTAAVHLCLLFCSLYFLWEKDWKQTREKLGIWKRPLKEVSWGIAAFLCLILVSIAINIILYLAGINDSQKTLDMIGKFPLYILVFAVLFAPISEELFFRAFLTNKIGILGAAAVFGLSHIMYGSVTEIMGAFFIGLFLSIVYKYSKSIMPVIIAHFLFNLTSLLMAKLVYGI